jgi:hypothetical protein
MDEVERWIYLDGPEPTLLRPLLDALRNGASEDEDEAALEQALLARIDGVSPPSAMPRAPAAPPQVELPAPSAEVPARFAQQREEVSEPALVPPVGALGAELGPAPGSNARPSLAGTAMALELPAEVWRERGKLPFGEPLPPPAMGDKKQSHTTKPVPVMRGPGDTVGVDDDMISRAVAAVPFLGETIGSGRVPFPRLSVESYASLHAELAVRPELSGAILLRYRVVSHASLQALDAHWVERFASHPEEKALYHARLPEFIAHVRAMPR